MSCFFGIIVEHDLKNDISIEYQNILFKEICLLVYTITKMLLNTQPVFVCVDHIMRSLSTIGICLYLDLEFNYKR